jgi:hypothetical protein
MALHPLEGSHRPVDRRLQKDLRQLSRRFAKASKRVNDGAGLNELTYVVLATYLHRGQLHHFIRAHLQPLESE